RFVIAIISFNFISFYLRYSPWIFSVCFGENAAKKKEKVVSVFVIETESEKEIEWAAKFYQQEKWLEELDIQKSENAAVAESASRSKIQLEEPDEESQLSSSTPSADGTWKTISGRAIVSREKLLEKLDESVSCRFCRGRVQVMENVATKHGLFYLENPARE
ncbi:unnamed protein product, partial [Porites lobata]